MTIFHNDNPTIINDFLNYLLGIKNYSINTIKAYNADLLSFFYFIKEYCEIEVDIKLFNIFILSKVTEADIIAFLVYLNRNHDNNPYTRQRKLSCIRSFYKWLYKKPPYDNKVNPTYNIKNIKKLIRVPKYLDLEQSKKISKIFTLENSMYPERNNTIIYLFLNTGLRLSELVNLNIQDINFNEKYLTIVGKGNKERIVLINESTKKQLLKYLKTRNKGNKIVDINSALFVSHQNKRLGTDGVEDICKKAFKLMGMEDYGYTTHTLRHTAAVLIYQYVKSDLLLLKKFLGHANINSTQIYTHTFNENVKNAVDSNPLNSFNDLKVA